jgi:two-component system OmpR family response regulator
MRLLVIEDDRALAGLLRRKLLQARHVVDLAHDGPTGLEQAESGVYDALILDLMLPGLDGVAVAQCLREHGIATPIIMLTARDALHDRLQGFGAGADDYLTKPFAFEELLARLRAVTRRSAWPAEDERLAVGDLVLDSRSQTVTRAGRIITLAPKEYALLEYMMRHAGQVLSRTLIMEHVWEYGFDSYANVVDAIIRRLRKAVDDGHERPLIHTVRGIGYKIKADG